MFRAKRKQINKTHLNSTFSFLNRDVYEKMWKNTVQLRMPQMTIWCTRIACWVPEATNILIGYVIFIDFPMQQWLHDRVSLFRYTYLACLVSILMFSWKICYTETTNCYSSQQVFQNPTVILNALFNSCTKIACGSTELIFAFMRVAASLMRASDSSRMSTFLL